MTSPDPSPSRTVGWRDLRAAAPGLADRIQGRFASNLHHVIGTLRADGAPRLSGTEVTFSDEDVRLGMMPGSQKLRDVRRDARVEVHSAPLEDDLRGGDAKLAGLLTEIDRPSDVPIEGAFFRLVISRASLVRVDGNELVFEIWDPAGGLRTVRRR